MDPPPSNDEDYIRVLLYSYYTTITGWGVLLHYSYYYTRHLNVAENHLGDRGTSNLGMALSRQDSGFFRDGPLGDSYVHLCVRLYMYVCMHACMRACVYVCMYAGTHVCRHACMHVRMFACMYACMHACMSFEGTGPCIGVAWIHTDMLGSVLYVDQGVVLGAPPF